ncbi:hypothetical protein RvY_18100-2 [Ramazzottius varieornatus]|uniref:Nucleoprotein TPR n=1 Tax=Ramazzottius varieornatus TaxID=947166 RepID=A0A1D1W827_RAMVA|nr:hypothetical protein RvY_18100-2 [Ramazzottius varieornatus]
MDSSSDLRPRHSQEATNGLQSLPKEKIANMAREVYRIRMDLTSRECELKYSKAAEAHLRSQLQQLTEDNSSLRQRLLRQEEQRIAAEIYHDAQLKQSSSQVDQVRDNLRTEFSKTALLERQLTERTTRLTAAQKLLEESEKSRKKWMEHHTSHSGRQEAVIGALNEHTRKLLEDQLQLEAEAAEASKEREEVQRVHVDELQTLQDSNAKLQAELREKDGQVGELSRQLRNARGQLTQYSNAPNGQFKLTSELYASLVASEDKVAALEEENARLKVQQKQSLQTVQTFGEELTEVRNSAMETAQVLRKAEKLIVRLKREGAWAEKTVSSDRSRSLLESGNMAATERELQLYREQAEDDQKRNFFSLIAHAPERYDEVMTVARDQAVLWAFVAEHGAEAQVRQVESLKNAITVLQQAKTDLQTQNAQLCTSLKDSQHFSSSEIERVRAQLTEADESICSLTAQCYQLRQDKATLASQQSRLDDELKEAKAKLEEADKARRHLAEGLDKEKMASMQQSSEISQIRSLLVEVASQKELLSMKEQTSRGEIQHLENVIETLSAQLANADIVYWVSESKRIKSEVESDRLLLHQASAKLASLDNLDRLQAENQALQQRLSSLQAQVSGQPTTKPSGDADMEMIANLTSRARLALESQAHEAALASLQDARAEVATLQLALREHEKQEQHWKNTITSLKSQAAAREKTWREEVRLLTEQINNHQTWMDSTLAGRQETQEQGSVLSHMVRHSGLLQQRLKLAQEELAMLRRLEDESVADNVAAGTMLRDEQSKDVWQSMYQKKSSLLSSMVEYSATLRNEALTLNETVKELRQKGEQMSRQTEVLESEMERLRAERNELSEEKRRLEGELKASIERFDTGAHRAELENLKKQKAELEKKRRSDLENQKEHYRKQFEDMRKKNVDTLISKTQEAEAVKEQLEALQKVHGECGSTEQTLRDKMRSVETQLAARDRMCLQAVEECNKARVELAKARDGQSRLRAEVQSSQAKEKQLLEQLNAMVRSGDRTDGAAASASAAARIRLRPASSLLSGGARSSAAPAPNLSLVSSFAL